MPLDLFEFISFPDHNQQQNTIDSYFNTQSLWIDLKQYCQNNNLSEKTIVSGFDGFFETANNDFREKVRRFNNSIIYLTVEVFRLTNYYNQWLTCDSNEEKQLIEIWFRYTARCVCNEIFMYEEKIKNLLRHLFKLDKKKTRRNDDLLKELNKLSTIYPDLATFCATVKNYYGDKSVEFVTNIRNDEIYNDSRLDEYTDKLQLSPTRQALLKKPLHVIKNETLLNTIKQCLNAQLQLKDSLQKIIDNFKITHQSNT